MKNFILACIAGIAAANTNADDPTGIFGDKDQWKTGIIPIKAESNGPESSDMFYWLFNSRQET
jgi:hypothetical protein